MHSWLNDTRSEVDMIAREPVFEDDSPLLGAYSQVIVSVAVQVSPAVGINTAKYVSSHLLKYGKVCRSLLGIAGHSMVLQRRIVRYFNLDSAGGVQIISVERDSPADRAGMLPGDIILALNGHQITGTDDLQRLLSDRIIGRRSSFKILRLIRMLDISVVLHEKPEEE